MQIRSSIVLNKLEDSGYEIISSAEEVRRFNKVDGECELSPATVYFEVYSSPRSNNQQRLSLTPDNTSVEIYNMDGTLLQLPDYTFYQIGEYIPTPDTEPVAGKIYYIYEDEQYKPTTMVDSEGTTYYELKNKNRMIVYVSKLLEIENGYFKTGSYIIRFNYKNFVSEVMAAKAISLQDGVTDQMAKFNITAAAINAKVADSSMKFTSQGLEIKNGNFAITNDNGDQVFGIGQNGTLEMRGTIHAENGSFSGDIKATNAEFFRGRIGGFKILPSGYYKTYDSIQQAGKKYYILNEDEYVLHNGDSFNFGVEYYEYSNEEKLVSEVGNIQLLGKTGQIIANNIELGKGAKISDQIDFFGYKKTLDQKVDNSKKYYIYTNGQYIEATNLEPNAEINGEYYEKTLAATICNPESHDGDFITAGDINIRASGVATFGDIVVNGQESELRGNNWYISGDHANFSNVNIRGSIETAVFKSGSTQAVGGAMIFRPSYKIREYAKTQTNPLTYEIELEEKYEGLAQSHVWICDGEPSISGQPGGTIYILGEIKKQPTDTKIELEVDEQLTNPVALIDMGRFGYALTPDVDLDKNKVYYYKDQGNEYKELDASQHFLKQENGYLVGMNEEGGTLVLNDYLGLDDNNCIGLDFNNCYEFFSELVMGINAGNVAAGDGSVLPRGLTITDFNPMRKSYRPHLFLGDLRSLKEVTKENYTGYGLYADNVYLNGSLTTKLEEGLLAGVNTTSKTLSLEELVGTISPVVFWAGAETRSTQKDQLEAIKRAPFQITQNGYLYAQNAKLANSLIAGANIYGANIYAATIHGYDSDTEKGGALTIYDTSKGIIFKQASSDTQEEKEIFAINSSGLTANANNFISIFTDGVEFAGNSVKVEKDGNSLSLTIKERDGKNIPTLMHKQGLSQCGLYFNEGSTRFEMGDGEISRPLLEMSSNGVTLYNDFKIQGDDTHLEYQNVPRVGFNLYVYKK